MRHPGAILARSRGQIASIVNETRRTAAGGVANVPFPATFEPCSNRGEACPTS